MAKFPAYPNLGRHIRKYPLAAGASFLEGALVLLDANGDVAECGADPALILGVALHDAGADPHVSEMLVAVARADSTFVFQGSADPVQADEGDAYGVVKDGDGIWTLDKGEAVNTRLRIEKVYIDRKQYECVILAANRQLG